MARVLVTGMSGAGKATVLDELRRRGHLTVDTDYDSWELSDGTWDEQQAEIVHYTRTVEPLLRSGSTLELDGRRPVTELADAIERLMT